MFGINTTRDISKLPQISLAITFNNFEVSLVVFMPNITTNHAITYTNFIIIVIQMGNYYLMPLLSGLSIRASSRTKLLAS